MNLKLVKYLYATSIDNLMSISEFGRSELQFKSVAISLYSYHLVTS